jgi:hypothetical protein
MAHMSREFTLVLLGAGLLTAGYFLYPDDDPTKKAEEQFAQGKAPAGSGYRGGHVFLLTHHYGRPSPALSGVGVNRGGFGGIGRAFSGGG